MHIQTPDMGVEKAQVAEILVQLGEHIDAEQSIVLLESDKASVEVPSPIAGVVTNILVQQGDSVKEGVVLIEVAAVSETAIAETAQAELQNVEPPKAAAQTVASSTATSSQLLDVTVPDIGVEKAQVVEVLVKVGDGIDVEQSIVVVESDKAAVEIPSTVTGTVASIPIKVGDSVKEGVVLIQVKTTSNQTPTVASIDLNQTTSSAKEVDAILESAKPVTSPSATPLTEVQEHDNAQVYAGPAVRKLARELGVVLSQVDASGEHGRVIKEDVFSYVKNRLNMQVSSPLPIASSKPSLPDFSAFGGGELKAMTRLQQVAVPQLSLNHFIPQVTHFDVADISDLEAWRNELKAEFRQQGIQLTILAFITKAVAHLLKQEPYFAAHLADDQQSLLLRHEIHLGIAVATADGLTVPVLRNPDQKSIRQLAIELSELSHKARDKQLTPKDLQGANFTITSLGGIGGTAFTPLVNWPQVAILGISPATMQPVWNGQVFEARLMLPLSLSYDHRVINGADAARFSHKLCLLLKDIRAVLL